MNIKYYLILYFILFQSLCLFAQNPTKLRFKLKPTVTIDQVSQNSRLAGVDRTDLEQKAVFDLPKLGETLSQYEGVSIKRVIPYNPSKEALHRKYGFHLWYEVDLHENGEVQELVDQLKNNELVDKAGAFIPVAEMLTGNDSIIPDDPNWDLQWGFYNTGEVSGSVPTWDINLPSAWNYTRGDSSVIVAVIDGAINSNHEDLQESMWVNVAEQNGLEGVDDDNNGYIDDIYGYDFKSSTGSLTPNNHGSHVAGTVGARSDNGIGVAGVAGGDSLSRGVQLMSCQVFASSGSGAGFAEALIYAADNGAVIAQNSWGYSNPGVYDPAVLEAIDYFIAEAGNYEGSPMKGGIVTFAAGNSNSSEDYYPAYYGPVIAVASINSDGERSSFSHFGSHVDITAPGGSVYSTKASGYGYDSGTSMACPHVSGVAALILSVYGHENFTPDSLQMRLLGGTRAMTLVDSAYYARLGVGLTNANEALLPNDHLAPNAITDLEIVGVDQTEVSLEWTVPLDSGNLKPYQFELFYDSIAPPVVDSLVAGWGTSIAITNYQATDSTFEHIVSSLVPNTVYYFKVRSVDMFGNYSSFSNADTVETELGADIHVDVAGFEKTLTENYSTLVYDTFHISNLDTGYLSWSARVLYAAISETTTTSLSEGLLRNRDDPKKIKTPHQQWEVGTSTVAFSDELEEYNAIQLDDTPDYIDSLYHDPDQDPADYIGSSNSAVRIAVAVLFEVPEGEDPFYLTHIQYDSRDEGYDSLVTINIKKGGTSPELGTLIYTQEYGDFTTSGAVEHIELDEIVALTPGDSIYVELIHPLGVNFPTAYKSGVSNVEGYYFLSGDGGASYVTVETYFPESAFHIRAMSIGSEWPYMELSLETGIHDSIGVDTVAVSWDGNKLDNGVYEATIQVSSNDYDNGLIELSSIFRIRGKDGTPMPVLQDTLNLGDQMVYEVGVDTFLTHTFTYDLENTGTKEFSCIQMYWASGVVIPDTYHDDLLLAVDVDGYLDTPIVVDAGYQESFTFSWSPDTTDVFQDTVFMVAQLDSGGLDTLSSIFLVNLYKPAQLFSSIDTLKRSYTETTFDTTSIWLRNEGDVAALAILNINIDTVDWLVSGALDSLVIPSSDSIEVSFVMNSDSITDTNKALSISWGFDHPEDSVVVLVFELEKNYEKSTTSWDGNSWSNGLPDSSVYVVLESDYTVTDDIILSSISVAEGVIVTIPDSVKMTITEALITNHATFEGKGILKISTAGDTLSFTDSTFIACAIELSEETTVETNAFVFLKDGAVLIHKYQNQIIGGVTVTRKGNLEALAYNYWSLPFADRSKVHLIGVNHKYVYDEESVSWVTIPDSLEHGRGFTATGAGVIDIEGTALSDSVLVAATAKGSTSVDLGEGAQNYQGFNLVGNPFLAALDYESFIGDNAAIEGGALYMYSGNSDGTGGYSVINSLSDTAIAPFQGFFVKVSSDDTIRFYHEHKSFETNTALFRKPDHNLLLKAEFEITTSNTHRENLILAYGASFTEMDDYGFDAKRFNGNQIFSAAFTKGQNDYSILALPSNNIGSQVVLDIFSKEAIKAEISLESLVAEDPNLRVWKLEPNGEKTLLSVDQSIEVYLAKGENSFVFEVRAEEAEPLNTISPVSRSIQVLPTHSQVTLLQEGFGKEGVEVIVTDVSGRVLFQGKGIFKQDSPLVFTFEKIQTPLLFIQVLTTDQVLKKKFFITSD